MAEAFTVFTRMSVAVFTRKWMDSDCRSNSAYSINYSFNLFATKEFEMKYFFKMLNSKV